MGQRISSENEGRRSSYGWRKSWANNKPSFSMMDFASFWLGGLSDFSAVPLPTGWDEPLDWTEHASEISAAIANLDSSVIQEEHQVIRIVPYVLSSSRKQVNSLLNMPYIERAAFYAESVSGL
jgi:hypothetical protein